MSKNLYNYLNTIEATFFFKKKYFFVIKDSLSSDKKSKSSNFLRRQLIKANFTIHLTSSFFMFRNIKFPLHVLFFSECSFLEECLLNLFFDNSIFLFFKYNSQIISLSSQNTDVFFNLYFKFLVLNAINKNLIIIFFTVKSKKFNLNTLKKM